MGASDMLPSYRKAAELIAENVKQLNPGSILAVGPGVQEYGRFLRGVLEPDPNAGPGKWAIRLDGVETLEDHKTVVHEYVYDAVSFGSILDMLDSLPSYDVVLLIDVLGSCTRESGYYLVKRLLSRAAKELIVLVPLLPEAYARVIGASEESVGTRWGVLHFKDFNFSYQAVSLDEPGAQVFAFYPEADAGGIQPMDTVWYRDAPVLGPLTVGYILPHHGLTGGLKMLLEQIRHLRMRGHRVRVIYRGKSNNSALPRWTDVTADEECLVPSGSSFASYLAGCDVVVAGWFDELPELSTSAVPVLYLEQGHEWLFGECDLRRAAAVRGLLRRCYSQPAAIAAVSPVVADILRARYGRNPGMFSNGIDTDAFFPGNPPGDNTIILVGNPLLRFKGMDVAIRALEKVWQAGYRFKVIWVTPVDTWVRGVSFPLSVVVNPPQSKLPDLYRSADILLFTSWYEGFGMPPLESMASGVPVVMTASGGVSTYAEHGVNSLLAEPGDVDSLAEGVMTLLEDPDMRRALGSEGRKTSLRFQWRDVIKDLEEALEKVASGAPKLSGSSRFGR